MKEQELLQWLITEKANAMQTCKEYRKVKDVNGALIAGTEASAFALVIKRTKEIFNISSNVPVMRSVCDDWIHNERIKMNDDKYCPICGKQLQAN